MHFFDYINQANADYIEQLYQRYQQDPRSLDAQWQAFFAGFEAGLARPANDKAAAAIGETPPPNSGDTAGLLTPLALEVADLVHSYRELGHFVALLDPLGHHRPDHPLLDLKQFGLADKDLDQRVAGQTGFLGATDGTLRDLLEKLRKTYCSNIGIEYMSITNKTQRQWLQQRMEPVLNQPVFSDEDSRAILDELVRAQGFEEYLGVKFQTQKRFSLEGAEALIPLLNTLVNDGAALGVEELVFGMAHRGRLNVLAHVLQKPYEVILAEFAGATVNDNEGDGDVKYHLGYSSDRVTANGRKIHLSLSFNPSHLELVNPVVVGAVRAKQNYMGDHALRVRVAPVLIHGDASFTGQGIVSETLNLSELPYYRTGGTIHIIVNNQVGFTTFPRQGRFTPYPTDVAKMIEAPIFHVNGDDPEACVHAARLAMAFRQEFHQDVLIDLWCYRRHGHNEVDEPSFTQPLMYKEISAHLRPRELYAAHLESQGKLHPGELDELKAELRQRLDQAQADTTSPAKPPFRAFGGAWSGLQRAGNDWSAKTSVTAEQLRTIGEQANRFPENFTPHPKIAALYARRCEMAAGRAPIDWGGAEMLSLGSLVLEGTPIRFVGQDTQRGTFSHRHAALRDYENGNKFVPLANLSDKQAPIIVVNTMLSELAVLAYEYGFSSADPRNLVLWEAQFGDFVNEAQPVIDQFIAAAESKWKKYSGLVLLLPHGYEGQGPEHSNAYLERFLSLCAEDNMQVVYPSLPSQYFHVLRRQIHRNFRKPLILMMPKALLRSSEEQFPGAASRLVELTEGTFQNVIDDPMTPAPGRVRRLLLCAGKVYFTLNKARLQEKLDDVAIVRIEQLYPFPQKELQQVLARYQAQEICWVQEESRNRGAWSFFLQRLTPLLPETAVLTYCGRDEAASPATGSYKLHEIEEQELVGAALELPRKPNASTPLATAVPTPARAAEQINR